MVKGMRNCEYTLELPLNFLDLTIGYEKLSIRALDGKKLFLAISVFKFYAKIYRRMDLSDCFEILTIDRIKYQQDRYGPVSRLLQGLSY